MSTFTIPELSEYFNMLERIGGYTEVYNALYYDKTFKYIASGIDREVFRYKNVAIKIGAAHSNYIEYFLFSKFRQHPRLIKYFPAQYSISPKRLVLICEYVKGKHPIDRFKELLFKSKRGFFYPQDTFSDRMSTLLSKCGFDNIVVTDLHAKNLVINRSERRRVIIDAGHFCISRESPLYKQYSEESQ